MKIDHEFTVSVPVDRAWAVLTDLEAIAPCMPGAQLTGVDGDVYSGKVKIKVGPVVSQYAGTAKFLEKDDAAHRAVIDAKGRDSRGAGNASALITAQLHPDGDRTRVTVETELKITGRIAQFGSGMIKEVSTKLLGQFVSSLEEKLLADNAAAPAEAAADKTATAAPAESASAGAASGAGASGGGASGEGASGAGATGEAASAATLTAESVAAESPAKPMGAPDATAAPAAASASADAPAAKPEQAAGARVITPETEAEPLDVLSIAGNSIYKRLIPVAIALVVVIAIVVYLVVS
jgi:carbon monoxide dehydrogenase subunit G